MQNETFELIDKANSGDKEALQNILISVQDMIYNLSLRMMGSPHDAEDAAQETMIKIITQLATFRKESTFSTWVYRIATNHLINYKKSMFARHPLSFEYYGEDINAGFIPNTKDLTKSVDEHILAEELKLSCTNVMLQCLDAESRCIYVLGIMFRADSKVCGEIFGITPDAYRQRLSRIRKKVAEFLSEYCGLSKTGTCNCQKRVGYAIQTHRLNPQNLEYRSLEKLPETDTLGFTQAMEEMDELSLIFANLPKYRSSGDAKAFFENLLASNNMSIIRRRCEMSRVPKVKELVCTRLASGHGGWVYCSSCGENIGYLCYVTYDCFRFSYKCKCGENGSLHLAFEDDCTESNGDNKLITIKNRLCCPHDNSPLFTILYKKLDSYQYEVICTKCGTKFTEKKTL